MSESKHLLKEIEFPDGFNYSEYFSHEKKYLNPLLEAKGYSEIVWYTIERDSFGPLSRGCTCKDSKGNTVRFWYG